MKSIIFQGNTPDVVAACDKWLGENRVHVHHMSVGCGVALASGNPLIPPMIGPGGTRNPMAGHMIGVTVLCLLYEEEKL